MNDSRSVTLTGTKRNVIVQLAVISLICLSGCKSVTNPFRVFATMAPKQSSFSAKVVAEARQRAGTISNYQNFATLTNRSDRDRYISDAMITIDEEFKLFVRDLGVNITGLDT